MNDSVKSKTVIGAFVVGAVVLAVVGVIVFGGGRVFKRTIRYIMFFEGSVKGLNVGAPVVLRGVRIGQVRSVKVLADPADWAFQIPVVIEIDPEAVEDTAPVKGTVEENLKSMVEKGLRARLNLQSLVTGQLLVELEVLPDQEPRFSGTEQPYPEIPTVPSTFERIAKTLQELPIAEILNKISATLTAVEKFVENPALAQSLDNFNQAIEDIQKLIVDIDQGAVPLLNSARQAVEDIDRLAVNADGQLDRLGPEAQNAIRSASAALNQLDRFLTLEYGEPARLAESFRKAADSVPPALGQTADAFGNIANMTGKDSPDRRLLDRTLKELSDAARSVRIWAEYLERHPEALITGKGGPKRR